MGLYAVNISKSIMYDPPRQTQTQAGAICSECNKNIMYDTSKINTHKLGQYAVTVIRA